MTSNPKIKSFEYNLGRRGHRWRKAQQLCYTTQTHCWICGEFVDQTLPSRHRMSRTADHVIPLEQGGAPLDPTNIRLAHRSCNSRRARAAQETQIHSEEW